MGFKAFQSLHTILFLCALLVSAATSAMDKDLEQLKVQIYGYPIKEDKSQSVQQFNSLQPENLSITTPGLTIAKLGSLGQKTSLRFNSFTSGDLAFLYDGFEISDMSDPSEGFDISSFLMVPEFDMRLSTAGSMGIFSRQVGGVISIDPGVHSKSYLHTSAGSFGQGVLSLQKNKCTALQCLSFGIGGTYSDGQSASVNSSSSNSALEKDSAGLGFLSLGWQRQLGAEKFFKFRAYSQMSRVDVDDYDQSFVFKDDPNARMNSSNHFLGVSYLTPKYQFYFENTLSSRHMLNEIDSENNSERDETYQVFKSKLRGSHKLVSGKKNDLDLYWFGQSVHVNTLQMVLNQPDQEVRHERLEGGVQLDKRYEFKNIESLSSVNGNILEGFGTGGGISQTFETLLSEAETSQSFAQLHFGFKERRPSFFQLFDPQFGNNNLENEEQLYIRPKLKWAKLQRGKKHNISLEYFYEKIDSRVVFVWDQNLGESNYSNTGSFSSNSFILDYSLSSNLFSSRVFFRQSLDSQSVLRSLPWAAEQELGLGGGYHLKLWGRPFHASVDMKWLLGMFNPSGEHIGNLVQSQGSLSYQFGMNDKVSLQLNNIFNDKKIWDEGFQRQPFSWMLSLTKTI